MTRPMKLSPYGLQPELHYTSRGADLKSWLYPIAVVLALVLVFALVQYHDDNVNLRAEVQAMKSRGCPASIQGRPFIGSQYKEVDLSRPKYATLACYYKTGVKS